MICCSSFRSGYVDPRYKFRSGFLRSMSTFATIEIVISNINKATKNAKKTFIANSHDENLLLVNFEFKANLVSSPEICHNYWSFSSTITVSICDFIVGTSHKILSVQYIINIQHYLQKNFRVFWSSSAETLCLPSLKS